MVELRRQHEDEDLVTLVISQPHLLGVREWSLMGTRRRRQTTSSDIPRAWTTTCCMGAVVMPRFLFCYSFQLR